ncbi:inner membrane protein [Mucilaginibacter yixingensis]|uniref:Inner membrane protein n=1 Tax=Mucilaginibacter yixingensis TaxID=1295612 RepID=A0A2T5JCW2_9SPHI|nr:cell envelope integrity protein CreD [Mucilaginibacter yixingensis]PTQ99617.1 inner membrane protein [Mucilaginibacter yixingensis]
MKSFEDQPQVSLYDRLRNSVLLKLAFIGILILVLLIPTVWIQNLITERAGRQNEVIREVAASWSDSQQVKGPTLLIPYRYYSQVKDTSKKANGQLSIHLLPDVLHIKANVQSSVLHRGIFNVIVYNSKLNIAGSFSPPDLRKLNIDPNLVMYDKARLVLGMTDLKGLKNAAVITVGDTAQNAEPVFDSDAGISDGIQVPVKAQTINSGHIPFSVVLDIKGSQKLSFMQLSQNTDVEVTGDWPHPSFEGRYLPDERTVDAKGFSAVWKMAFNRILPRQWATDATLINDDKTIEQTSFGVKLLQPVDQYQQTMRTSKYGVLIIILTFVSLFLTELIRQQRVHVFNYVLIGAAMVVYYTLLLSFSEQIGYNLAYLVASIATIGLISFFLASILKNKGAATLFAFILTVIYGFIYIIVRLEDYALMVGSIALFIIVAMLMYFSHKINWDKRDSVN